MSKRKKHEVTGVVWNPTPEQERLWRRLRRQYQAMKWHPFKCEECGGVALADPEFAFLLDIGTVPARCRCGGVQIRGMPVPPPGRKTDMLIIEGQGPGATIIGIEGPGGS